MSNSLLDETRSDRLDLGLAFIRQLRVSPTVAGVLAEEKPAAQTWGDFAILSMVSFAVMARMVRGDLRGVIRLLVRLVGQPADGSGAAGQSAGGPDARQIREPAARWYA